MAMKTSNHAKAVAHRDSTALFAACGAGFVFRSWQRRDAHATKTRVGIRQPGMYQTKSTIQWAALAVRPAAMIMTRFRSNFVAESAQVWMTQRTQNPSPLRSRMSPGSPSSKSTWR